MSGFGCLFGRFARGGVVAKPLSYMHATHHPEGRTHTLGFAFPTSAIATTPPPPHMLLIKKALNAQWHALNSEAQLYAP